MVPTTGRHTCGYHVSVPNIGVAPAQSRKDRLGHDVV